MSSVYEQLAERIRGEVPELEQAVQRALHAWSQVEQTPDVYTFNLVPEKIAPLISSLPQLWPRVRAELLAFADFLEDLARES